jgi:hypothetical protein
LKLSAFRLLADALRGVGAPFGGARRIEFLPALPGGVAAVDLLECAPEVAERLETKEDRASLDPKTAVLAWTSQESSAAEGVITLGQLKGMTYEGQGVWQLREGKRFRLLADRQVSPSSTLTGPAALLEALQGNGEQSAAAHSIVTLDARDQFEVICEITTIIAPVLEAAVSYPDDPSVKEYLESERAKTVILACRNTLSDEVMKFDLPTLLRVQHRGAGIFELDNGLRFAVLALRPVTPEVVQKAEHGFVLPRMDFRPPSTTIH